MDDGIFKDVLGCGQEPSLVLFVLFMFYKQASPTKQAIS